MYAVLETGSKQYRVAAGDTLEIERLAVEAGQPFTFDRVLLVNRDLTNTHKVTIGFTGGAGTAFAGTIERIDLSPENYVWRGAGANGYARPDGPLRTIAIPGGGAVYNLPASSITVLRGKIKG